MILTPQNQKTLNTRGMALFSDVCDWRAQKNLLSGIFCNVWREENKNSIIMENFSLEGLYKRNSNTGTGLPER